MKGSNDHVSRPVYYPNLDHLDQVGKQSIKKEGQPRRVQDDQRSHSSAVELKIATQVVEAVKDRHQVESTPRVAGRRGNFEPAPVGDSRLGCGFLGGACSMRAALLRRIRRHRAHHHT
jgi:hypothetical protein